ncbi:MAG TPA: hypothetical protein VNN62_16650 [Methylomirabilota bacterium]|jgi:hypothetical protein|uniref:hypothetical protein n=1 Tax=Roseiflexus sp. TaxID=2562120 RepID=UPI0025F391B0|nr:hypothetical protein [Roseiflexus sp.]MCL6543339.1 hypothetical protein [Roseiflexus sp.]HXG20691.1 hypothetical protein [Methylomirabilota bacterium]
MLANQIGTTLRKICRGVPQSVISSIAVDLADLYTIGITHRRNLRRLVKLRGPQDSDELLDLLVKFDVSLLFEAQYHLRSLKRLLPRLEKSLTKKVRGKGKRRSSADDFTGLRRLIKSVDREMASITAKR